MMLKQIQVFTGLESVRYPFSVPLMHKRVPTYVLKIYVCTMYFEYT